MVSEQKRYLLLSLIAGGAGVVVLLMTAFWVSLLLINHHPAFIPNAEKRIAMFKSLTHRPRQGGSWSPKQGENWIF